LAPSQQPSSIKLWCGQLYHESFDFRQPNSSIISHPDSNEITKLKRQSIEQTKHQAPSWCIRHVCAEARAPTILTTDAYFNQTAVTRQQKLTKHLNALPATGESLKGFIPEEHLIAGPDSSGTHFRPDDLSHTFRPISGSKHVKPSNPLRTSKIPMNTGDFF
jgi:hypothetical protein